MKQADYDDAVARRARVTTWLGNYGTIVGPAKSGKTYIRVLWDGWAKSQSVERKGLRLVEEKKPMKWTFEPGQRVVKTSGYPFPGVVLVSYTTASTGHERVVVELCAADGWGGPTGLQHIFSPHQLAADERFETVGLVLEEEIFGEDKP